MDLFPTAYCGSISYYTDFMTAQEVVFDCHEHFIKQTERSRCKIYGPNGIQTLSVPVHRKNHTPVSDIYIDHSRKWNLEHWRSLKTAYASTPYFEDYGHEIETILTNPPQKLIDLNLRIHGFICNALSLKKPHTLSEAFAPYETNDRRLKPKTNKHFSRYYQPFSDKKGFISNLSILDLLFNEGPESSRYLSSISTNS